ncbi:MAG: MC/SLC25 family protein [archaeon]|nr:MC/SLC25 family protein [archaeon]
MHDRWTGVDELLMVSRRVRSVPFALRGFESPRGPLVAVPPSDRVLDVMLCVVSQDISDRVHSAVGRFGPPGGGPLCYYSRQMAAHLICSVALQPFYLMLGAQGAAVMPSSAASVLLPWLLEHLRTPPSSSYAASSFISSVTSLLSVATLRQLMTKEGKPLGDSVIPRALHTFSQEAVELLAHGWLQQKLGAPESLEGMQEELAELHQPSNHGRLRGWVRAVSRARLHECGLTAMAQTVAALVTSPLSTVRARIEAQGMAADLPVRYHGVLSGVLCCARDIWREEGVVGFYQGVFYEMKSSAFMLGWGFAYFFLAQFMTHENVVVDLSSLPGLISILKLYLQFN